MSGPHYLAFDFGTRNIGVAVGQKLTRSATPLTTVAVQQRTPDWTAIDRLIDEWSPRAIVVGMPVPDPRSASEMTRAVERFGGDLQDRYNLKVYFVDERLTTESAKRQINQDGARRKQKKTLRDQVAAQLILQTFLSQPDDD